MYFAGPLAGTWLIHTGKQNKRETSVGHNKYSNFCQICKNISECSQQGWSVSDIHSFSHHRHNPFRAMCSTQESFTLFGSELNISSNFIFPAATQQSMEGRDELDSFLTPREMKTVSRSESWPLAGTSPKGKHFPGNLVPDGFTLGRGALAAVFLCRWMASCCCRFKCAWLPINIYTSQILRKNS